MRARAKATLELRAYTLAEAACLLDLSPSTLRLHRKAGRLKAFTYTWWDRPPGTAVTWRRVRLYIRGAELERFMRAHEALDQARLALRRAKATRTQPEQRALWREAKRKERRKAGKPERGPTKRLLPPQTPAPGGDGQGEAS